jgi:hypothetical protein
MDYEFGLSNAEERRRGEEKDTQSYKLHVSKVPKIIDICNVKEKLYLYNKIVHYTKYILYIYMQTYKTLTCTLYWADMNIKYGTIQDIIFAVFM